MSDWIALLACWAALVALVAMVRWAAVGVRLGAEGKRKAVHIGMGLVTIGFPWLFSTWMWVAALCGLSLATLLGIRVWERRKGVASVLHDVDRDSLGEICFPIAVVWVFALAEGEPWRFIIPMLILTLADAAGALVGASYGRQKFRVLTSGSKSMEGSLLVFLVAFLSVHIPLLLMTDYGRAETLLIALILA
ncbi:MAG: hypothetical protein AAF191_07770, partial [Verrucomicrobiota bacterium]